MKINIPDGFDIPKEFQKHFDLGLPLLESQVKRLNEKIVEYSSNLRRTESLDFYENTYNQQSSFIKKSINEVNKTKEPFSFDLSDKHVQEAIKEFLNLEIGSALEISKLLIERHLAPNIYDASGKPRVFPYIVVYLDSLVQQGFCLPISKDFSDRIYRVKNNSQENIRVEKTDLCYVCGKRVSEKVRNYCLNNQKFKGKIYCFDHQKNIF